MWLLKLSSKSQECCLAKICSCWSLPRVRHRGHSRHVSSTGQVAHRAGSSQSLQGATPAGWMSRGTSRWFSSKPVRSAWSCVVKRHLWVPYSSSCFPPQGCRRLWKVLPPEQALPQHLAKEMCSAGKKKHAPAAKRDLVSFMLLLLLCSAPCTYLSRSALTGGFWDCQAASFPAQHLLRCLLKHILSAYLFQEKQFFWEWHPQLGRAV